MKTVFVFLLASLSFGATGSPVAISAIARAANVVTATCSAPCNIAANQGFSIQGVTLDANFNLNGTAISGSGTTFTFNMTGANTSIGAGGTVTPAKEVIVLSVIPAPGLLNVSYLFWNTTISGVTTGSGSSWSGASAAEVNAIKAGTTIESAGSQSYPNTYTKAQIQTDLQIRFASQQSTLATGVQPGQFFGGFFDGAGWSF